MIKEEISKKYREISEILKLSGLEKEVSFEPLDMGYAHVDFVNEGEVYYVVTERGQELQRKRMYSIDDLLYSFFSSIVSSLASNFIAGQNVPKEQFRNRYFNKRVEIMKGLSHDWARRDEEKFESLLKERS